MPGGGVPLGPTGRTLPLRWSWRWRWPATKRPARAKAASAAYAKAMMRPIVTLTMNSALDVSTSTDKVVSEHKMRCGTTRIDPGGGGVNVARVVRRLGGQALAIYTAGGATGGAFRQLIEAERVPTLAVPIAGSTRESFTVDETSTAKQFRFVLEGPELTEPEWQACLDVLEQWLPIGGFVVASGSLPPGVPDDFYARVARMARQHEAHCIVDASGPSLAARSTRPPRSSRRAPPSSSP
ncbi:1-phosphofructokinase family hexose kinase [Marisediminicola antarctica]